MLTYYIKEVNARRFILMPYRTLLLLFLFRLGALNSEMIDYLTAPKTLTTFQN